MKIDIEKYIKDGLVFYWYFFGGVSKKGNGNFCNCEKKYICGGRCLWFSMFVLYKNKINKDNWIVFKVFRSIYNFLWLKCYMIFY